MAHQVVNITQSHHALNLTLANIATQK